MSLSPIEIVAVLWGIVIIPYFILFLYRSIVGMHEQDNLYLSDGEARLEAEQREIMKQITKLDVYSRKLGIAALAMTALLAGMWLFNVARNLW
jgi:hypothetical protein